MAPAEKIRGKITHALDVFPVLSPSALHVLIGPNTPTSLWRPTLEELIKEGVILQDVVVTPTPMGQHRSYTRLFLACKEDILRQAGLLTPSTPNTSEA